MKRLFRGLLLIVLAVSLSGCGLMGNQNNDDSNSEQQTPTSSDSDLSGSLEDGSVDDTESSSVHKDMRIISLMPSNTEILDALGVSEYIVGISSVDTYPKQLVEDEDIAKIDAFEFDAEQVLDLEPTHIFSHETSRDMHEGVLSEIEAATGAEVIYVEDAASIEEIYGTVTDIGEVLSLPEEAEAVNSELQESIDETVRTYEDESPVSVFVQISPYPDVFTAGENTFIDDVINTIGAENIFTDIEGFSQVSAEDLVDRDPDYVVSIIDGYDAGQLEADVNQFTSSEHLSMKDREHQCALDPDTLSRPGPRIDEGMEQLAACVFE